MSVQTSIATSAAATAASVSTIATNTTSILPYDPKNITLRGGVVANCTQECFIIEGNAAYATGSAYLGFPVTLQGAPSISVSNRQLYIISSNANDTSAGTGSQTVWCKMVAADGTITYREYTLNGTTAVDAGTADLTCEEIVLGDTGSGAVNAGTITVGTATPDPTTDVVCQLYIASGRVNGPLFQVFGRVTNGVYLHKIRFASERTGPFRTSVVLYMSDGTAMNWVKEDMYPGTKPNELDLNGVPAIPPTMPNSGLVVMYMTVKLKDQGLTGTNQHGLYLDFSWD